MGLNVYQQATLAMMGQSHKLNTISQNIANMNTDGFKRTDTEFQTLMSGLHSNVSADPNLAASGNFHRDLGGVKPTDLQRIAQQGQIRTTDRNLDAAIAGSGFFMVSPDINVNSNIQYTRRGSFELNITDLTDTVDLDDNTTATVNQGFLADQFGNFVLGVPANPDGSFTLGNPAPMRLDQFAFEDQGLETGSASLNVNLPADDAGGTVRSANIEVVDSGFNAQNMRLDFTKVIGQTNLWDFRVLGDNITSFTASPGAAYAGVTTTAGNDAVRFSSVSGSGGVLTVFENLNPGGSPQFGSPQAGTFAGLKAGDTITIAGSTGNDNTYTISSVSENQAELTLAAGPPSLSDESTSDAITFSSTASIPQRLQFGSDGNISSDEVYTFDVTFDNGESTSFEFDAGQFTQFSGDFNAGNYEHNGAEAAALSNLLIGPGGEIIGEFTDNTRRNLYKIPIATFPNPDALEIATGQNFRQTEQSGEPTTVFADQSGQATIMGNALEGSNVDLGTEMTRLIAAQSAYNVAATTFKTADEMMQKAADLKR